MPRDPEKARLARERREALNPPAPRSPHIPGWVAQASTWPLLEVQLSEEWDRTDMHRPLVGILLARRSPAGPVAGATFLVDLGCLGVKTAAYRRYKTVEAYSAHMRTEVLGTQPMHPESLDLVAKILDAGIAYAKQLGIDPDPDYWAARELLSGAAPERCPATIPLGGPDNKPLFVNGPYDNVPAILATLTKTVGPDGFDHMLIGPDNPDW